MTARLRPHHLLCILTYSGHGYSPAFSANMTRIAGRLGAGERIEIVAGPDDICAPLLADPDPHCRRASVWARDRAAARELGRLSGVAIRPGAGLALDADLVQRLRAAFAARRIRAACAGCEWFDLCGATAASGFDGAVLRGHSPPRAGNNRSRLDPALV